MGLLSGIGGVLKGVITVLHGYVYEGKHNFTGVVLNCSQAKTGQIIKDSDYDEILFYELNDAVRSSKTGYGIATNNFVKESLTNVKDYEKSQLDNDFILLKVYWVDGDYTVIKLDKRRTITQSFEKALSRNKK